MKKWSVMVIVVVVVGAWLGSGLFIYWAWDDSQRGTIGDMFGAVNALFAGLAFAGIIFTIAMQRRDLELQRRTIEIQTVELKMQRAETARSADQLESQRKLLNYQLTVAHVNELISLKNKKIGYLKLHSNKDNGEHVYAGMSALTEVVRRKKTVGFPKDILNVLDDFLRIFFYTLKYIDDSDLDEYHKRELKRLIVLEISKSELEIIKHVSSRNETLSRLMEKFDFEIKDESIINDI